MAKTVIVHILNQDPIVAEVDNLPDPKDSFIAFSNPRKLDGKAINIFKKEARLIIFPWNQIYFVEVMESAEERREIIDFFRET